MNYLQNLIRLLQFAVKFWSINTESGSSHTRAKKIMAQEIYAARQLNDGTIPKKIFLKIQWYMVTTLFVCETISLLFGSKMHSKSQRATACLGALECLSDILIDDYKLGAVEMSHLLSADTIPKHSIQKVFGLYYKALMHELNVHQQKRITKRLHELIHWQIESSKQFNSNLDSTQTHAITMGKGGTSIVLCGELFDELSDKEENALFSVGGFVQYMNDAQDLHKDACEGIQTFAHFETSFKTLAKSLQTRKEQSFDLIRNLDLPLKNKNKFLFTYNALYIGILYKLKKYSELLNNNLNLSEVANMEKKLFRVNMVSVSSFFFCTPKILGFKYSKD